MDIELKQHMQMVGAQARAASRVMAKADTHAKNAQRCKTTLMPKMDLGYSALLEDLDDRGLLIAAKPRRLVVPPAQIFTATRILKSQYRPGTADNDVNALWTNGTIPEGWKTNHWLVDPKSWYIMTDIPNGLKHFTRVPLQTRDDPDFDTGNLRYKARERYSFGWSDPLGVYGSP